MKSKPSNKKSSKRNKKSSPPASTKPVSRRVPTWIGKLEECAHELNLGSRRIQQLAKEGLPRADRGVYDVVACFRWYVRYLQRKLVERALPEDGDGDGGGPATSASATRHKMLSIEAELKQIELAEKRETLISIEKVQKDIEAIVVEIRTRILALAPKIAAEVVGETDLAISQVKVDRALRGALAELSEFDPDEPVEAVATPVSTLEISSEDCKQ